MKQYSISNVNDSPDMHRLINEHGDSLLRMCFLYLHDLHLAEDALQDTYIKVYQNWNKFRGDCSEKTWITSIAINVCKSKLRSPWFKRILLYNDPAKECVQHTMLIEDDTVLKEISKLKPKYKEVVLLFYYRDMKTKEIAKALGLSESAVCVRLSRAREQLMNKLKGWYFNE